MIAVHKNILCKDKFKQFFCSRKYSQLVINNGCVRLAPLGLPRCVVGFFPRTNVGNYLHKSVLEKKPPHTGVDPGELNERTQYRPYTHDVI